MSERLRSIVQVVGELVFLGVVTAGIPILLFAQVALLVMPHSSVLPPG